MSPASSSPPLCIPTIDYQDFPSQSQMLLQAAEEWGCFRLINHTIPATLMAEMKATAKALLDLPLEIKQRNKDVFTESGYMAATKKKPLCEALGIYNIGSAEAVDKFCSQVDASALQREIINKYFEVSCELARDICRKLCQSMGVDVDLIKDWTCQFRMHKYSFTPEAVGSYGLGIHTDSGLFTIVYDDECVGGIEVMHEKLGAFVAVDPLPGSFLVNFGDVAKVWSNGRICAVRHRVLCKEGAPRISMPLFVLGPKEGAVEAPPELVDDDHPRLFLPLEIENYRKLRASTDMRTGALALMLRKPNDG